MFQASVGVLGCFGVFSLDFFCFVLFCFFGVFVLVFNGFFGCFGFFIICCLFLWGFVVVLFGLGFFCWFWVWFGLGFLGEGVFVLVLSFLGFVFFFTGKDLDNSLKDQELPRLSAWLNRCSILHHVPMPREDKLFPMGTEDPFNKGYIISLSRYLSSIKVEVSFKVL